MRTLYEGILSDIDTALVDSDKTIEKLLYGEFPAVDQPSTSVSYVWHCPALIEKYSKRIKAVIGLPYATIAGIRLTYHIENNEVIPDLQFLTEKWFRSNTILGNVRGILGFVSLYKTRSETFKQNNDTMYRLYSVLCMFRYNFDNMMKFVLDKEVEVTDAMTKNHLSIDHPYIINKYAYGYTDLLKLNSGIKELKGKI